MRDHLRIVSWNIRAGGGKRAAGILDQLLQWSPDIISLCEFRGTSASQILANELASAGFSHQLSSVNQDAPAKNALLIASRVELEPLAAPRMPRNRERWLLARAKCRPDLAIGLMHIPNYSSPRLKYPFMSSMLNMARTWKLGPALLMGDTNCGMHHLDEENPLGKTFKREHEWMISMQERGFNDVFRDLHGNRREYTWYSHRNNGFRLDQAFCNPVLKPAVTGLRHVWGIDPAQPARREALSDHAAMLIDLDLTAV